VGKSDMANMVDGEILRLDRNSAIVTAGNKKVLNNFFIALYILFLDNLLKISLPTSMNLKWLYRFMPGDEFHLRRILLLILYV